jgi:hypothetical protein
MAMLYVHDAYEDARMIFVYVGSGGFWKEAAEKVVWIS